MTRPIVPLSYKLKTGYILYAEFIHLLASEASDISEQQQKKVISPEHVVEALATLGFQEYVPDVKAVHKEYKEQASVRTMGKGEVHNFSAFPETS